MGYFFYSYCSSFVFSNFRAIADNWGSRKRIMLVSTLVCVTARIVFPTRTSSLALTLFIIANISFEIGTVFCNAYLAELSSEKRIGKVSGMAWGLGYVGGLIALVLALYFLYKQNSLFWALVQKMEKIWATNLLVALWFLIFSLPIFVWIKDKHNSSKAFVTCKKFFVNLKTTFKELSSYRKIFHFCWLVWCITMH